MAENKQEKQQSGKQSESQNVEQKQEKLNDMYTRLQMIDQEIKQIQAQMQALEQQMQDIAGVVEALNDLGKVKQGNELLIPVAGGIFVKAKLEDPSHLLINVGASVNVKKSLPEVVSMIESQAKELESTYMHLQEQFQAMFEEATSINEQISPLIS